MDKLSVPYLLMRDTERTMEAQLSAGSWAVLRGAVTNKVGEIPGTAMMTDVLLENRWPRS